MRTLTLDDLVKATRGIYQYRLLAGGESWSGSSLRGSAKKYSSRYAASRTGLLCRLREMYPGHTFETELRLVESRWRRVLVVDGEIW